MSYASFNGGTMAVRWQPSRGTIAFFSTYRPPVPLDIFSCPVTPSSAGDELHLTDGVSYNYNGQPIPPAALKDLLSFLGERNRKLAKKCGATVADVDAGRVTGLVFVSERSEGLETLHVALRFNMNNNTRVKVLGMDEIYGSGAFGGTRLEDSGCIAGGFKVGSRTVNHSLIYISTKEPVEKRRSPWTKVYRTNLRTGETESLTPSNQFDLSPAVSPSGKMVAVASFVGNNAWRGEIENLKTNIYVMNADRTAQGGLGRDSYPIIKNGGWPSWGSDNVIFFHRGADTKEPNGTIKTAWGVFRYDITTKQTVRVTPMGIDCMTPAAINETHVALATTRSKSKFTDVRTESQYRHIEIFDNAGRSMKVTQRIRPRADHYNPFVMDGGRRVGYHRCHNVANDMPVARSFNVVRSPVEDVGLFRVPGVFPTISRDGSKLAFVDNEFKSVWLADGQGLRVVYETKGPDNIFSPVWNQNPDKDILYVCMGPSFNAGRTLEICAIPNVSSGRVRHCFQLTKGRFNNAFPSSSPDGTKFVFRSTRDGGDMKHKNLYIMEKGDVGEYQDGEVTRLTNGPWTDTHCQWSPNGDWIVFSSTRDKPVSKLNEKDHGLDPGYFAVYLVKASDPTVVVRVIRSGSDLAGHVNHPVFSPDGRSIAVTADLAAVSVDPISLPLFVHSVRPYGDIFVVDIDPTNIKKNKDVKAFRRVTHSRYENATPCWTLLSPNRLPWADIVRRGLHAAASGCAFASGGAFVIGGGESFHMTGGASGGGESFHMTGHLIIPRRCC